MADMQEIGTELYNIVVQVYPELAPKLTGMLLQLGADECIACLENQEQLAMRLDEAFLILDNNGQCAKPASKADPNEKRIDPEDGKARTLEELRKLCQGQYSVAEIDRYWQSMKPASAIAPAKAKGAAKSVPAPGKAAQAAPKAPVAPAFAPTAGERAPSMPPKEAIPGLTAWLTELKLTKYADDAADWASEMGACTLGEIVENLDDFAEALCLKPLERKRVEREGDVAIQKIEEAGHGLAMVAPAAPAPATSPAQAFVDGASEAAAEHAGDDGQGVSFYAPRQKGQGDASASRALIEQAVQEKVELERDTAELEELERAHSAALSAPAQKASAVAPIVRVAPNGAGPVGGYTSPPAPWSTSQSASAMADAAASGIVEEFPALTGEVTGKKGKKKR